MRTKYAFPFVPAERVTGGGSEVLVLESNQNHAIAKDTETCPTLPAAMGMGGGYVPMVVEVINDLSKSDRDTEPRSAPRQLQRTGRIQRYADNK